MGSPDQTVPRIADKRCPCIRDQRDVFAGLKTGDDGRVDPALIIIVIGSERCRYAERMQEMAAGAGILRQDKIHATQYLYGTRTQILQIADRRGHYI